MTTTNHAAGAPLRYASPEMQVITFEDELVLCISNSANSPEKGSGFDWNDDLY